MKRWAYATAAAVFAPTLALAADPGKPMSYNDGVFCSAIYGVASDFVSIADADYLKHLKAQLSLSTADAYEIGAKTGKTRKQVEQDFEDASDEVTEMIISPKPGDPKFEVFERVCDDIIAAHAKAAN